MNSPIANNPAAARRIAGAGAKPGRGDREAFTWRPSRAARPREEKTDPDSTTSPSATSPSMAYGDILWAVLNGSEFTLVR